MTVVMKTKLPRDERGWRVPHEGTKSHEIYKLLVSGVGSGDISRQLKMGSGQVRVLINRIKYPERNNKRCNEYNKLFKKKARQRYENESVYVRKLIRVLGMTLEEALAEERKALEKERERVGR